MEENNKILTFTDDEGNEVDLEIIDSFEMDGKKYAALAEPETGAEDEESVVFIMEIVSESEDEDILVQIEDEAVLDKAFETFVSRCEDDFDFVE